MPVDGYLRALHKTLLDEFYRVAFRKKLYDTPDALQADLDEWMAIYNEQRTHQGRSCSARPRCRPSLIPLLGHAKSRT